MEYLNIDGHYFYNMMINASNKLESQKEYINSLNVFPVPDGDTGTNMSMTFRSAVMEIKDKKEKPIGEIAKSLSRGALMGARGNSGVILSQILRGIAKGLENKEVVNGEELAESIIEGSKSAYKAVMRPTEGTILTIIRAAGEAADKSRRKNILELMKDICEHSSEILSKTPEMLPVLKEAKVVDAGGAGLLVILQGMYEVLEKNLKDVSISNEEKNKVTYEAAKSIKEEDIKFGYCTEFFIVSKDADVDKFKKDLETHGDSMIVVGSDDLVKVHIHTNDPGKVLSKAIKLGPLSKIKIDNMREQHRHILEDEDLKDVSTVETIENSEKKEYAFISVALGEGIRDIFNDLGVDFIIEGGQTMNPSTEDIIKAIDKINAENIFILPNNKNIIMAAKQAKELSDKNIHVIETKTIPQGVTALTMFNFEGSLEDNINAMEEGIKGVKTGSVTYAVRDTEVDGKAIKSGDIIGIKEGNIEEVGNDIYEVCEKLIKDMVNEDSELITLFYGEDCDEDKVNEFLEKMEETYEDLDVQCFEGKQPLYYFIISVE
ncbi:DAK2 domain-containing protein [Clostridium tetani]|uniref:DAK2 domain-containing protein n=1 Tax=Clostridium tetani TaxID=1513 RepID=A0ABY0EL34_CLOTA|nr:DAK2 domain-containing protein [Clostridium tetani]KHO39325.1 dihydroxyacetone kinase [Clostridium tetani]RXI37824.1 DAK2 domain-containing protein [Clostridium tetani]RXI51821.1 DAK2 domain-containing protein [Clostridium tetani]RXI73954.1 DAK2 domain-containing protein [Clostridium tetani]